MLEVSFVALVVAFPTIGAATRRWIVVVLPLFGWPIYYLGMNRGWWLDGTGDGWESIARAMTVVGVVTTAAAVALARSVKPVRSRRPSAAKP
ncbi:MAG TPA: hypothetical protein VNJ53_01310 [Gaiellaceae bacterium]|nr:hypothetical protein [Gaiellaceae bacterium]